MFSHLSCLRGSPATIALRAVAAAAIGVVLSTSPLYSQDLSRYRGFRLGGNLASISAQAGVAASEAKSIHLRPAILQELQWRRPYSINGARPAQVDSVEQLVFSFYDDQLSRIVVNYDRDLTAGMTDADLIDAISTDYGPQVIPGVRISGSIGAQTDKEPGMPIGRWGDADHSVVLYRLPFATGFRMIVTSPALDALARSAADQARRLDEREAPARDAARQQKAAEDARAAAEKARLANKATFQP